MTNYTGNKLLLIAESNMIVIDPVSKTSKILNNNRRTKYLTYSPSTSNMYVITEEEEDEISSSQCHYCLYCISPNQEAQRIVKFQPEVEIIDVQYADATICVHSKNIQRH